jgi:hypothetical protein
LRCVTGCFVATVIPDRRLDLVMNGSTSVLDAYYVAVQNLR